MHQITDLVSSYPYEKSHISTYPWVMRGEHEKKKVHVAGLGDVGLNASLGLRLTGAGLISEIGIYDINQNLLKRLEIELNQILSPLGKTDLPDVRILSGEELFDCDIFLFCAAKSVPPVGAEQQMDVRIAQLEENRKILSVYAKKAAKADFHGLFGVVSDPLDLLCYEALKYLHPDQIQGFGLGVMFARAAYYASKEAVNDSRFSFFRKNGRVYGPHGSGLTAVNSILPAEYSPDASRTLTSLTAGANLAVRSLGYKPYIAPGISSVAMTIPEVIAGRCTDSARYLNGVFFGARNRVTSSGTEWEAPSLPQPLFLELQKCFLEVDRKGHTLL